MRKILAIVLSMLFVSFTTNALADESSESKTEKPKKEKSADDIHDNEEDKKNYKKRKKNRKAVESTGGLVEKKRK